MKNILKGKMKKKLFTLLGVTTSIVLLATPSLTISCKKNEKPEIKEPEKPKPEESTPSETPVDKINKYLDDELDNNLSIIDGKENDFYHAINNNYVFYSNFRDLKIMAVKPGEEINYKNGNYVLEFKGLNKIDHYQLANDKESLQSNGKISSKVNYFINEKNEIVFAYKAAIHDKNGKNHIISTKIGKTNLGKKLDNSILEQLETMNEKAKEVTFTYPNIADVLLQDANFDLIQKNIPAGYELVKFKPVKNTEKEYYGITVIFKLKIANSDITMLKNASFTIKGFKKTQEIIDWEDEAKNKLNNAINDTKVFIQDEKAYQHIIAHQLINNFDNKPNFAIKEFDSSLFKCKLQNVKVINENNKNIIKVLVRMMMISNEDVYVEKEVQVQDTYNKGFNPHNLTEDQQVEYLKEELNKVILHPFYSKDKYYMEKLNNGKITYKSYWINAINYSLKYNFDVIKSDNDKRKVNVIVKFADWKDSPKFEKEIEIDFSKLGIDIQNEIRAKKGLDPVSDIQAPSSTIVEPALPDLSLKNFVDTDNDDEEVKAKDSSSLFLNDKLAKIKHLYAWDQELYDIWKEANDEQIVAQYFSFDIPNLKLETNLYFWDGKLNSSEKGLVYVFSKPKLDKNNELTVKVTISSVNEYNAATLTKEKVASKRIVIKSDNFGSKILDSYKLKYEIVNLKPKFDFKNKENITLEQMKSMTKDDIIKNITFTNLSNEYKLVDIYFNKKWLKNKTFSFQYVFEKNGIQQMWSDKTSISGFSS